MNEENTPQVTTEDSTPIYYVGIGASAGGLEAIERFFSSTPPLTAMAFILIQHLSPDYKSLMVELLSKRTEMPVRRAEEGLIVEAGTIYIIPPKKNLRIFQATLQLTDQNPQRGLNHPIDIFFRSLAEDQQEKAVGVILSGTGSDGMLGCRTIKEKGGMVLVQSLESSKFTGMPQSAISTGLVDFIMEPEEMVAQLCVCADQPHILPIDGMSIKREEGNLHAMIFNVLRDRCGVDFSMYKMSTVGRRIERRMLVTHQHELKEYLNFIETSSEESTRLYKELLIGVTCFFRDHDLFNLLRNDYLPDLLKKADGGSLRFWSAACSTGEEAYTLAILCRDLMDSMGLRIDLKIFATDVDRNAILSAGNGVYPESIAVDIPPDYLSRYFYHQDGTYRIIRSIREMVVFAQHNITQDPPFNNIDLLICRNLLIYFQPILQQRVLQFFSFSLNRHGILVLGSSESVGDMDGSFGLLESKWKIYRLLNRNLSGGRIPLEIPGKVQIKNSLQPLNNPSVRSRQSTDRTADRLLEAISTVFLPLTILVNEDLEALQIVGNCSPYFSLPSGRVQYNITKMAHASIAIPLATGLQKAFSEGKESIYTNIPSIIDNNKRFLRLRIMSAPGRKYDPPLALITVEEINTEKIKTDDTQATSYDVCEETTQRLADMEQELQFTKENLQATIEELETSNEELQATNEELLASNEELQSTNEELHSVNEELHTVNAEYQLKIMELTELNNDLNNLFSNSAKGIIFLDENLDIRKFTPPAAKVFHITSADIGRPIGHLSSLLPEKELLDTIKKVHQSNGVYSHEQDIQSSDGAWYLLQIIPYAIGPRNYSGVIVATTNITALLEARQESIRAIKQEATTNRFIHSILNAMTSQIAILDQSGTIIKVNQAWRDFAALTQSAETSTIREGLSYMNICDVVCGNNDDESLKFAKGIRAVLSEKLEVYEQEFLCSSPDKQRWFIGRVIRFAEEKNSFVVVTHDDITPRKLLELQIQDLSGKQPATQE